ncbi:hypothetical protein KsCSTR_31150 [Candidatus Kuenenia stuttgartiensis]|uniref:Uncharacterized protein n=1 Tax=Kuenenia stuttgartiensis TaxID=174633 RepID=Q1Q519_KUEST|nr:hypothetical protein KsCSTR_31150 [Candidatus Kuenenia stuttgartiensis]CAJ75106.1 unknown protein [Candidatus Kuenenia stuttgartiensis]
MALGRLLFFFFYLPENISFPHATLLIYIYQYPKMGTPVLVYPKVCTTIETPLFSV